VNRETLLQTSRGIEFPLIPRPFCKHCTNPISEKWAKISGRCWFCAERLRATSATFGAEGPTYDPSRLKTDRALRPFAFRRAVAVGLYVPDAPHKGEFGRLVADFKYHGKGGPDLAEALDLVVKDRFPGIRLDILVPIPPEPENSRNAPLVLARTLAARGGCPVVQALSLDPRYKSDKGASREEKFNATKDQFRVQDDQKIAGQRIGLIDDVMTTCGHAHWASRALLDRGASSVTAVVLARTFDLDSLKAIGYDGRA
jgi:predicted amidophosphoribosyltransferase